MAYLKDFQNQINTRNYPAFLRLWEEYCGSDEIEPSEIIAILKAVKQSEFAPSFGRHVEEILPLWDQLPDSSSKETVFQLIIDLQTTQNDSLREKVLQYLSTHYGSNPHYHDYLKLVGLRGKEPFSFAIASFKLLVHMQKGNFVFHTGGWGVGEIIDVSSIRQQVSLEFDYVSGKKDLSFVNAFKTLIPIPQDHFLALRFGNPDLLEEKAKENPIEVIRLLLRDLGPKTAAEIKDELCDLVIPEKEWGKWWQQTRAKIKKDTMIESPSDLKSPFILRSQEITNEERLQKVLAKTVDPAVFIPDLYSFLKDFSDVLKNPALRTSLREKIEEILSLPDISTSATLQLCFILEELGVKEEKISHKIQEIVKDAKDLDGLLQEIEILSFKKELLSLVKKERSDWKELFLTLLFQSSQHPVREYLLSELSHPETERDLKRRLEDLWIHPSRYPELFLWYFQKIVGGHSVPFSDQEGKCRFFEGFFILLSSLENSATHKDLIKKMHNLLTGGRYAIVRDVMQGAPQETVQEFLLLASKCHSLSDHEVKILHSLGEVVHPALSKLRKHQDTASDTHTLWTTPEGYKKVQDRLKQIALVETVENAKEIEVARSHGDLKENQEFKAAKERQARLQSEMKQLSEQIDQARILTKEDVSTDEVGVGTVVHCKNKEGKTLSYTLLGPWDADPEKHILSTQSKLAQTMKGLTVGEKFQFQGEELTISSISSYFDTKHD